MADQSNAVTVKFRLTSSEVFRALAGYTIRRMWFMLLLPIVGSIAVVWALLDPANGAVNLNSGLVPVIVGVVLFGALPYLQTRATMKGPNFGGVMSLTASDQGIEFTGEHSNARIDWSMISGVLETNNRILINLRPAGFQIVPKQQMSPTDLKAFRDVLRLHAHGKVKLADRG